MSLYVLTAALVAQAKANGPSGEMLPYARPSATVEAPLLLRDNCVLTHLACVCRVYFPNTNQLRNQYVANEKLGYPMCLSTCA